MEMAMTADVTTLLLKRAERGTVAFGKGETLVRGYTDDAKLDIRAANELMRSQVRCNELYAMIKFLREHDEECIGDHPDWLARMDRLIDPDAPTTCAHNAQSVPS